MGRRYEVTDEEWECIKEYIPTAKTGRPPKDHRQMFNAMMWLAKSGAMWEDLPERYDPWKTVYSRFCMCRDEGVKHEMGTSRGGKNTKIQVVVDALGNPVYL